MRTIQRENAKLFSSKIIKNFFVYSSGAAFLYGMSFFLLPVYTRVLSPEEYGKLALLNVFIAISSVIISFGLAQTVTIFYYKVDDNRRVETITNIIFLYIILSLPFVILMLFNIGNLNKYLFGGQISNYLIILAVMSAFISFFPVVYYNVLKMEEKALKRTFLQTGIGLFILCSNIYLVYYLRVGIVGILSTNLASLTIVFLIARREYLYKFKRIKVNLKLDKIKDLLKVGLPIVPGALAMWALNSVDRWILMKYTTYEDVGIYSVAYKFGLTWQTLILASFAAAYTPRLYRAYKDDLVETERKNMKVLRYYLVFSLIAVAVAVNILRFIFPYLIGKEYQAAYKLIWIILLGYVSYGAFALCNHFLYILKKTYYATYCVFVAVGLNIGLNFIFIPQYGVVAAAYTTMISFFAMFVMGFILRTFLYRKVMFQKRKPPTI